MATGLVDERSSSKNEQSCTRSALFRTHDAPDHISHIVRDKQGTIRTERDADRSPVAHCLVRCEEARQDIPRRPGRPAIRERDEDDLVAAQRAAVPRAVL